MSGSRSMKGAVLLALSAPVVFGGCVDDSVSLRISCNITPEDDCTYTSSGKCYLDGALNLASSRDRYHAVLLVANGLKTRARDVPPLSETNGVTIRELEIEVTDSAGRKPSFARALPNPFTVQATGVINPGEDGPVGAELLPRTYVAALQALNATANRVGSIRLSIIARGETWGGVDVETGPWPWTIQLTSVSERADVAEPECVIYKNDVCTLGQDAWTYACNPATVPDDG